MGNCLYFNISNVKKTNGLAFQAKLLWGYIFAVITVSQACIGCSSCTCISEALSLFLLDFMICISMYCGLYCGMYWYVLAWCAVWPSSGPGPDSKCCKTVQVGCSGKSWNPVSTRYLLTKFKRERELPKGRLPGQAACLCTKELYKIW